MKSDEKNLDLEFCTVPESLSEFAPPKSESKTDLRSDAAETEEDKPWNILIIILSLALGTFLVALDGMIVGVAVPSITSQFHSLDDISWYGSAYLLTTTALQPCFGKLYQMYNVKTIYLICVALFEGGSVACAAAQSSPVFIFGRALAGCGAAGLFQGALNIITHKTPLAKRPLYLSAVTSVFGISICIGPVLGGAFVQHATWRWCFWINLPIGCIAIVLISVFLDIKSTRAPIPIRQQIKQLDPVGALTLLGAICCLFLALQWGGQKYRWNSAMICGLFVGAGFLSLLFCFIQWKMEENATIPLRILKQRSILCSAGFLFFIAMSNYIYGYYLPIFFQSVQGSSATKSGVQFMALALPQIVFVILSGAVAAKWGYYAPYMIVGTVICATGSGLLTMIDMNSSTAQWAGYMVLTGVGTGICVNLPYTAVQAVLDERDAPIGNAIAQFSFQLGAAISLSIGQSLFLHKLTLKVSQTTNIEPSAVISAGAYNLTGLTSTPSILRLIREAYAKAVDDTILLGLCSTIAALIFALGMENRNLKKVEEERKLNAQASEQLRSIEKH